jgi:hypothetical protein
VPPPRTKVQDAAGVADRDRPGPALYCPRHHRLGGLVLGLADPPQVPGLGRAFAAAVLPPPPRSALPGSGCAAGSGAGAALAVAQVLPALGPDGPPGDQQLLPA